MFPECKINEAELSDFWQRADREAVLAAMRNPRPSFRDFLSLLAPAAADLLPELRARAASVKKMHFGKTVRVYSPLYISNYCINDCVYCGFRRSNPSRRRSLSMDEILRESEVIRNYGHRVAAAGQRGGPAGRTGGLPGECRQGT